MATGTGDDGTLIPDCEIDPATGLGIDGCVPLEAGAGNVVHHGTQCPVSPLRSLRLLVIFRVFSQRLLVVAGRGAADRPAVRQGPARERRQLLELPRRSLQRGLRGRWLGVPGLRGYVGCILQDLVDAARPLVESRQVIIGLSRFKISHFVPR